MAVVDAGARVAAAGWSAGALLHHPTSDDLYLVTQDSHLHVWLSTDDGDTWSEQDAGNAPAAHNATYPFAATFGFGAYLTDHYLIEIGYFTAANTLDLYEFDADTNAWLSAIGPVSTDAHNAKHIGLGCTPTYGELVAVYTSYLDDADLLRNHAYIGFGFGFLGPEAALHAATSAGVSTVSSTASHPADVSTDQVHHLYYGVDADDFFVQTDAMQSGLIWSEQAVDASAAPAGDHAAANYWPYQVSSNWYVTAPYIDADGSLQERTWWLGGASGYSGVLGTQHQVSASTAYAGGNLWSGMLDGDRYIIASRSDGSKIEWWIDEGNTGSWSSTKLMVSGSDLHLSSAVPIDGGVLVGYQDGSDAVVALLGVEPGSEPVDLGTATSAGSSADSAGPLTVTHAMAGSSAGASADAVDRLVVTHELAGVSDGSSDDAGDRLTVTHELAGESAGSSAGSVDRLVVTHDLAGVSAGTSDDSSPRLTVSQLLAGMSAGVADDQGIRLLVTHLLAGESAGSSVDSALELVVIPPIIIPPGTTIYTIRHRGHGPYTVPHRGDGYTITHRDDSYIIRRR